MGQGSGIGLCALALCAMYALRCMLIVYSHPIPMGQGSVMGLWALSSVLHALKIINGVLLLTETQVVTSRSAIINICFILPLGEVESGLFYLTSAKNCYYIHYYSNRGRALPYSSSMTLP